MINLIQNAAKVISSAGTLALKYVIRYTHVPKLLPIITANLMQSKSKDIRSSLCEIQNMVFEEWPTKALEKHQLVLRDALKKGISDADAEARRHSRRWVRGRPVCLVAANRIFPFADPTGASENTFPTSQISSTVPWTSPHSDRLRRSAMPAQMVQTQ